MTISRYRADWLVERGLDAGLVDSQGLSVVPDEARAENRVATLYVIGAHQVVLCAPADVARVEGSATWSGPTELPDVFVAESEQIADAAALTVLRAWVSWGYAAGAEYVGSGVNRVLEGDAQPVTRPPAYPIVRVDRDDADGVAKIGALIDASDPDDVDEADIDVDELDPVIHCAEHQGTFVAYGSARPFEMAPRWWDIGVLTHHDHRRKGLGVACVRAVIDGVRATGDEPLYRHNVQNLSSKAVAETLGFEVGATLAAMKLAVEPSPHE